MRRRVSLFLVLGLVLSIVLGVQVWTTLSVRAQIKPSTLEAQLPGIQPETLPDTPVEPQTELSPESASRRISAVSFCQTCGGNWPYLAGDFYFNASPNWIYKRGVRCQGALVLTKDPNTQVCARGVS